MYRFKDLKKYTLYKFKGVIVVKEAKEEGYIRY